MSFQRKVAVTWADIKKGDRVELPDARDKMTGRSVWDVLKAKAEGKKVKVTVSREGRTFSGKMPARGQVERFEPIKTEKWGKPLGKAEEVVKDILGADIAGVKPGEDELWVVPPVDPSTIAAHLLTFHGITDALAGREEGGWERMRDLHDADHEKDPEKLHVPHRHDKRRPVVDIGPRFH